MMLTYISYQRPSLYDLLLKKLVGILALVLFRSGDFDSDVKIFNYYISGYVILVVIDVLIRKSFLLTS